MKVPHLFLNGTKAGALAAVAMLLGACQAAGPQRAETFSAISPEERISLIGTEPFWGGTITGSDALWSTPENQAGTRFAVERFAGNSGVSFTGQLGTERFDLMVTAGRCSDGMSDRTYPYIGTVRIGGRQLEGCAWTDRQPFDGPAAP